MVSIFLSNLRLKITNITIIGCSIDHCCFIGFVPVVNRFIGGDGNRFEIELVNIPSIEGMAMC